MMPTPKCRSKGGRRDSVRQFSIRESLHRSFLESLVPLARVLHFHHNLVTNAKQDLLHAFIPAFSHHKLTLVSICFIKRSRQRRRRSTVPQFLKRFDDYVRSKIRRFPEVRDEVRGQWQQETRKGGKWQQEHKHGGGKALLLPRNAAPLQRNKRRCMEAIAEFRAWEKVSKK
jgi:hypothetical protein